MKSLIAILALSITLGLAACSSSTTAPATDTGNNNNNTNTIGTNIGNQAPDFTLNSTDGKPLSLKSLRGKYVMVYFWGSWCSICKGRTPILKTLYDSYKDKGFTILGVAQSDEQASWKDYISKNALVWNHVIESDNANNPVGTQFGVYTAQGGMSSYLLLDKIGNIVARGQAMDITEGVTATQLSTLVK